MNTIEWLNEWCNYYGQLPEDYLVFDCETSGLDREEDLILQLGWCVVENRKVIENEGVILNWANCPYVDRLWLKYRLELSTRHLQNKGREYGWTLERLQTGEKPLDSIAGFLSKIIDWLPNKVVAHNGIGFDIPIINSHLRRFLNYDFEIPLESVIDTGAIVKASQLNLLPDKDENTGEFATRVLAKPSRTRWSLDKYCVPTWELDKKCGIDLELAHSAPYDCLICYHLIEELRKQIEKYDPIPF